MEWNKGSSIKYTNQQKKLPLGRNNRLRCNLPHGAIEVFLNYVQVFPGQYKRFVLNHKRYLGLDLGTSCFQTNTFTGKEELLPVDGLLNFMDFDDLVIVTVRVRSSQVSVC